MIDTSKSLLGKSTDDSSLQRQSKPQKIRISFIPPKKERSSSTHREHTNLAYKTDLSRQDIFDYADTHRSSTKLATWAGSPRQTDTNSHATVVYTERILNQIKEEKQNNLSMQIQQSLKNKKKSMKKSIPDLLRFKEIFVVPREKALKEIRDKEKSLLESSVNKSLREIEKVIAPPVKELERKNSFSSNPNKGYLRSLSQADFSTTKPDIPKARKVSVETSAEPASPGISSMMNIVSVKVEDLKSVEKGNNVMSQFSEIPKERLIFEELMKVPVRNKTTGCSSPLAEERGIGQAMSQIEGFFKDNMKDLELKARGKTKAIMNDFTKIANLNFDMGNLLDEKNEFRQAIQSFKKFLLGAKRVGDKAGMILGMNRLGICYHYLRDYVESLEYHMQALSISVKEDCFASYYNIGVASRKLSNYTQAVNYLESALSCAKEFNDVESICFTLGQTGVVYLEMGRPEEAIESFKSCYEVAGDLKNIKLQLNCLITISKVTRSTGALNQAKSLELLNMYQKAYYYAKKVESRKTAEICLCNMGIIRGAQQFREYAKNFSFENVEGLYE